MTRNGDFIQTASGRQFWPLDPKPEDVCIEDIAASLSMTCRWGGHTRGGANWSERFISVAQHSVLVSEQLPPSLQLAGLLHDAPEALNGVGDVGRPMRKFLGVFNNHWPVPATSYAPFEVIEEKILRTVFDGLGIPYPVWHEIDKIKLADNLLLATEARDFMSPLHPEFAAQLDGLPTLPQRLVGMDPGRAYDLFMRRYHELRHDVSTVQHNHSAGSWMCPHPDCDFD